MANAHCPSCNKTVAAVWQKCLHCGALLPKTETEKAAAEQVAQQALEKAFRSEFAEVAEVGTQDKVLNAALFVVAAPFLAPAMIFTALMVKRWGRITALHLGIDALILNALAYSLKTHWGRGVEVPVIVSVLPSAMLIGTIAAIALWVRRQKHGQEAAGMLLGYSGLVVLGLILGSLFTIIPLLILMDGAAGAKTSITLIAGIGILAFTFYQVINES